MRGNKQSERWHSLDAVAVFKALETSEKGLSSVNAKQRLAQYGPNSLKTKGKAWWKRLIEPFTSLFVVVMLVAMAISLLTHELLDATVIGGVVVVNALIFYFQQFSVNRVLADLRSFEDNSVSVMRDGKVTQQSVHQLVPGDVVYIAEGLKIPADGRVIEAANIMVDESILTGESLPVSKSVEKISAKAEIYDQTNMVFKGTLVQSGNGLLVVCETGSNTQIGIISKLAEQSDSGKTPIEKKIDEVTKKILFGIAIAASLVFGLALIRGIAFDETLRFTLSLVVSVVPEGLPVTLTVILLIGAKRMAHHNALVKKMSSIETMGALTLIATDKTGTLTKNQLEVAVSEPSSDSLATAALASTTLQKGLALDPLDDVFLEYFKNSQKPGKRLRGLPFEQELRMSGSIWQSGQTYEIFLKGAPEAFLPYLSAEKKKILHDNLSRFTSKGYRTIGIGHLKLDKKPDGLKNLPLKKLVFDGLIGLTDPLRKNVKKAIQTAEDAGIKVVMLTGDHVETAQEIGRQAGLIDNSNQVARSDLLEKVQNKKVMKTILERIKVFGRVLPKHKYNFLKSVKGTEVTAMTGDGVNDIPALVEADAGLAMGSGTDAAKDSSDIVLLNNNFATIVEAVRLGRAIIANIKKVLFYLIATSLGEAMTMIGALFFGLPLPLSAVQILWVNLVTDTFTVLPIGISKPESHQMKQKPHDPKAPLLDRVMFSRTILTALIVAGSTIFIFWFLLPKGYNYAQTAAFFGLVVAQWANALNAAFERRSWAYIFIKPNFLLLAGILFSIGLQLLVMFGPLQKVFETSRLSANDLWLCIILPVIAVLATVDAHKLIVALLNRFYRPTGQSRTTTVS